MKLLSIIIPVKGQYKKKKFHDFCDVIYVNKYKKSKARNWGSQKAHSKYLMHIDGDNEINKKILEKIKMVLTSEKPDTVILEEYIKKPINIWQKARSLERKILAGNKILSTPQIISKKLFKKIGGYDERFNELDDWGLWMRLSQITHSSFLISHSTSIFEPTNVFQIFRRRFKKGQELKYFNEVYGKIPQTNISNIYKSYIKTPPNIPLLTLKFFDYFGLFLGSLFPVRPNIDKLYQEKDIALKFESDQLSLYGKIKDYIEKRGILNNIEGNKILDLGSGTGRLTKFLSEKNYKVTPCDISKEMLSHFSKDLPKPILLETDKLPFKNNLFDTVFSMRVIWHIKNDKKRERFFSESVRVSKKFIVMDFSFFGSNSDHQSDQTEIKDLAKKYNLKILNYSYLPLSRLLVKFEKK